MTAPRIALIEDDESLALLLRYNLEAVGYTVEWCAHGTLALRRVLDDPPDLVMLDWLIPGLSGIEILRKIRQEAHTRSLPVLMLTARTDREDRMRAAELGVDAFICKPFAVGEVMSRLQHLLSSG
jgi:two-component system phosphate regulon response regulator PhoB